MTDWKAAPLPPIIPTPGQAPAFSMMDCLWTVLASGDQTAGQYSLPERLMPGKTGPPPHVHERQTEVFYLLDDEMRIQLGTDIIDAGPGSLVSVPPGTPHGFTVLSDTARVLNLYVPAALDSQIAALGTPATTRTVPPSGTGQTPSDEQTTAFVDQIKAHATQTWADVDNLLGQAPLPPGFGT